MSTDDKLMTLLDKSEGLDFKLIPVLFQIDHDTRRKYFLKFKNSDGTSVQPIISSAPIFNGQEILFSPGQTSSTKYIMLDFDCVKKYQQCEVLQKIIPSISEVFSDFYKETTINGGIHVLVKFDKIYRLAQENFNIKLTSNIKVEFKTRCLMYPSHGYNIIEPLDDNPPKISPTDLGAKLGILMDRLSVQSTSHDSDANQYVNQVLGVSKIFLYVDELDSHHIFNELTTTANPVITGTAKKQTMIDSYFQSSATSSPPSDQTSVNHEYGTGSNKRRKSLGCVEEGGGNRNKKPKDVFYVASNLAINKCVTGNRMEAPVRNEDIGADGEVYRNRMLEDLANKCILNIYSCAMTSVISTNTNIELNDDFLAENFTDQDSVEDGATMPIINDVIQDQCKSKDKYTKLIIEIFKTNSFTFTSIYTKIKNNLQKKFKDYDIGAFQIFLFLRYLRVADKLRKSNGRATNSCEEFDGVYSTFEDYVKWMSFSEAYCKIVYILKNERGSFVAGNSSIESFSDFKLYREITRCNRVGHCLAEEFARYEYDSIMSKCMCRPWNGSSKSGLMLEFILRVLSNVKLDAYTLNALNVYNDFALEGQTSVNKMQFYKKTFFDIYLDSIKYCIYGIRYDSKQPISNTPNPIILYIDKLPWIDIGKCTIFQSFIKKCFPDSCDTKSILDSISSVASSTEFCRGIKTWNNIWPFINGIFDFRPNNPKKIIRDITPSITSGCNDSLKAQLRFQSTGDDVELCREDFRKDNLCMQNIETNSIINNRSKSGRSAEVISDTVFRNYRQSDTVINPINRYFNFDEYVSTFSNTNLLSLSNEKRYSKQFCLFFRSLFGASASDGEMGPFQYIQMLGLFLNLSLASFRDKEPQTSILLYGAGSNGKSQLLKLLCDTFTAEKFVRFSAEAYFSSNEINMQKDGIEEAMFLYDNEAPKNISVVNKFKDEISDIAPNVTRAIYKDISRDRYILASFILASNNSISYLSKNIFEFDFAFARRIYMTRFENTFKHMKHDIITVKNGVQKTNGTILFSKHFNLGDCSTIDAICRGMLYYMLDCIHVFNLCGLHSDDKRILSSNVNARRLAKENYVILEHIMREYVSVNELYPPEKADNFECVNITLEDILFDIKQLYQKKTPAPQFESVSLIKSNLKALGINFKETPTFMDDGAGCNIITGLVRKVDLSDEDARLLQHPSCSYFEFRTRSQGENCTDYIECHIPRDHLVNFHSKTLKTRVYDAITKILEDGGPTPLIKPRLDNKFVNIEKMDLINML